MFMLYKFNVGIAYDEHLHSYLLNLCNASRISNLVFKVIDNYWREVDRQRSFAMPILCIPGDRAL